MHWINFPASRVFTACSNSAAAALDFFLDNKEKRKKQSERKDYKTREREEFAVEDEVRGEMNWYGEYKSTSFLSKHLSTCHAPFGGFVLYSVRREVCRDYSSV